MANVQASTKAVETLFTEVFRDGNYEVADKILADDFRFQYPFPGFAPGPEGIKQFSRTFHEAFPGFDVEVNDLFGSQDENGDASVSIRWTMRGQHTGPFLGIPATGKYVTVSAIGVYIIKEGGTPVTGDSQEGECLNAGWLEMDALGLLQQLGAVQPLQQVLPNLRF